MRKLWNGILKTVKPFVRWWGKLRLPFTSHKMTGEHYFMIAKKIRVGDVLLSTKYGEFSNVINPEKIKHAALYVGDLYGTGVDYVVEAVTGGTVATDLVSFITNKDVLVALRPDFMKVEDEHFLQESAIETLGLPYDYIFGLTPKEFYCFELVAHNYRQVYPDLNLDLKEIVRDKYIYSYETFLNDERFAKYFDSRIL